MSEPLTAVICSTIGRQTELKRRLDSVVTGDRALRIEFITIDQSDSQERGQSVREYQTRGPWAVTRGGPGMSVARNVRIGNAPIPEDNCWYAPDTVLRVLSALDTRPHLADVSGRQLMAHSRPSAVRWLDTETLVGRTNFLRPSISSTLFLRQSALSSAAPFDEGLGVGSPEWHGACEESNFLLRLIGAGHRVANLPDIMNLRYRVGLGHLWSQHRLSKLLLTYHTDRKVIGSSFFAARGEWILAGSQIARACGTVAGWRGASP